MTPARALDYVFLANGLFFQKLDRRTILVADQSKRPDVPAAGAAHLLPLQHQAERGAHAPDRRASRERRPPAAVHREQDDQLASPCATRPRTCASSSELSPERGQGSRRGRDGGLHLRDLAHRPLADRQPVRHAPTTLGNLGGLADRLASSSTARAALAIAPPARPSRLDSASACSSRPRRSRSSRARPTRGWSSRRRCTPSTTRSPRRASARRCPCRPRPSTTASSHDHRHGQPAQRPARRQRLRRQRLPRHPVRGRRPQPRLQAQGLPEPGRAGQDDHRDEGRAAPAPTR